jgi:hypothetical protein
MRGEVNGVGAMSPADAAAERGEGVGSASIGGRRARRADGCRPALLKQRHNAQERSGRGNAYPERQTHD